MVGCASIYNFIRNVSIKHIIMKNTAKLLFAAALLFTGIAANAQDIDGISLWDTYTKAQLIAKYGQPIDYYSQMDDDNIELTEEIVFKDVAIRLEDKHVVEFGIKSTKPRAMTKFINGGIGVGDPESVTGKLTKYFHDKWVEDGCTLYRYVVTLDNLLIITVKNGRIIRITASATTT